MQRIIKIYVVLLLSSFSCTYQLSGLDDPKSNSDFVGCSTESFLVRGGKASSKVLQIRNSSFAFNFALEYKSK